MAFYAGGIKNMMETGMMIPNAIIESSTGAMNAQIDFVRTTAGKISEYWESHFDMMKELGMIYEEMLEQHRDPLSYLTTQGDYQVFMSGQKARKQVLETALMQLQILKGENGYMFPIQQQLENYIRTNLAFTFTFDRPDYDIPNVTFERIYEGERMGIKKFTPESGETNGETIFLIAPISGHFPTLLRKTIQALTDDGYEVCITDWKSCLQMSGDTSTSLDDYTGDISTAYEVIAGSLQEGKNFDVLAVCQPGPITLSSLALSEKQGRITPRSVTLMASPIDTSVNPTQVGEVGESMSPLTLHAAQLVSPKSGKDVYPGTYQINNFISANFDKHLKKYLSLALKMTPLNVEEEKSLAFYHEYFAVMDIPYDFFCETIERVFQQREWATGEVCCGDEILDLTQIQTPVAVVEGAEDDICGIGETKAALDIVGQEETNENYLLVEEAGHYGVFAGKAFRKKVIAFMKQFREKIAA